MKSSFQTFLIGFFLLAFIGAILIFSGIIKTSSSSTNSGEVTSVSVWGIYPSDIVTPYLEGLNVQNKTLSISYTQKFKDTLYSDLINALANNAPPDIILADSSNLLSFRDKLYTIPFATYNERLYKDSFVDGASIFLNKEGIMAVPLLVDPIVLYYNKDLLAGAGYVNPPKSWDDLVSSSSKFIKKDSRGVITQTPIALGESININNFKDILSTLFLQTGNKIVSIDSFNGFYTSTLNSGVEGSDILPTAQALEFYTGFADQASDRFSWTRTLPSSLDMFLSGKSAFYIGRASELFDIQSRNPNLSFDVSSIFQPVDAVRPITYGSFSGAGIIKSSPKFTASYTALGYITSKEFIQYLSANMSLPSVRRDLISAPQQNPYVDIFFRTAISAFDWPDLSPRDTEAVFRDMIRNVNSGAQNPNQAIYEASRSLQSIVR